tara:strand:- start:332 stop:706 length:375 start_codon:yes stop_codon:yes gene_type:complete
MGDKIVIVTKIPSAALSANSRKHWRVKHKASKSIKESTAKIVEREIEIQKPKGLRWHAIVLEAIYYHHVNRRRDPDNLVALLKYPIDGLVLGGLLLDDDLITLKPVVKRIDKENPRLELHIEPH